MIYDRVLRFRSLFGISFFLMGGCTGFGLMLCTGLWGFGCRDVGRISKIVKSVVILPRVQGSIL